MSDKKTEKAEAIALQMLTYVAENPDAIGAWLAQTGLSPDQLQTALNDEDARLGLLAGVFDFIMGDEALATGFAEPRKLTPEDLAEARARLPGGDAPNWL